MQRALGLPSLCRLLVSVPTLLQRRVCGEGVFFVVRNGENVIPSLRRREEGGFLSLWGMDISYCGAEELVQGETGWIDGWKKMDQAGQIRPGRENCPTRCGAGRMLVVVCKRPSDFATPFSGQRVTVYVQTSIITSSLCCLLPCSTLVILRWKRKLIRTDNPRRAPT